MIILGFVLLLVGLLLNISLLTYIAIVLMIIGVALWAAGSVGHSVGGRNHWY